MAQGVFDIIHPGHLYYLSESSDLGDELHVVIARDSRVKERKELIMSEQERLELMDALEVVDEAWLGSEGKIYNILEEVTPDIITIGYDQPYDLDEIKEKQEEHGYYGIEVTRIGEYDPDDGKVVSSSEIKQELRNHS
jgi:FAD synthetase